MEIVETRAFTRRIQKIMSDDEYSLLQLSLLNNPTQGAVIPGSGGLRKLRWAAPGKGKRGGVRIIYYWATRQGVILMLYVFKKNEASDLSPAQIAQLRKIVESEYP